MVRFQTKLQSWYRDNKRDLPWRRTKNPYKIWLSEVILQQTRVVQGTAYYEKFVFTYPTVSDLANASEQEVLNLWKGLGYYSRARNLHKTAKEVVHEYGGTFPKTYAELIKLSGVGPYTAAAISSFCFDEAQAVLDGNVFRVLSRIHDHATPINSTLGMKEFSALAKQHLNTQEPAEYNQAIMEFGALHCTPKKPKCESCPFGLECSAFTNETIEIRPQKIKKIKNKNRFFLYTVYTDRAAKRVYLKKRTGKDIWHNLFDFHLEEFPSKEALEKMIEGELEREPVHKKHKLTHQTLFVTFLQKEMNKNKAIPEAILSYSLEDLKNLPVPALHQKYIEDELAFLG
tara:strand:+ start:685 stop:1716 length:1032 start_codon:yes stop_codon:yes gene_type:complete